MEERRDLGGIWWYREDGSVLVYPRRPDLPGDRGVLPAAGTPLPLTYVTRGTSYVLTVQDPYTGLARHFEPAAAGEGAWWLADIEDRNHNVVGIDRGEDDTPLAVTHTGGYRLRITTATVGGQARVTALHALGDDTPVRLRTFGHDAGGNLVEVRNAVDAPLRFTYDGAHRITGWHDSNDTAFAYDYDGKGRVTATRGTDGILGSRIAYAGPDKNGSTSATYTDSLGHATVYRANWRGQIIEVTDPLGATTAQQWDARDHLLSRTDPLGRTTRWEWDDAGNLVRSTSADGTISHTEYNELHLPTRWTGPDGTRIQQEFDDRGNRVAVTGPDGAVLRFTHHPTGAPASLTDALGAHVRMAADPAGLLLTVEDARGARTTCTRDAFGRPVVVTDALGASTHLTWDAENRLLERLAADGTRESWSWDGEGNRLSHTDPIGGRTEFTYGPFDLPRTRTAPDGAVYSFAHDTEMRLTTVTDPAGLTWRYRYDERGALVAESDFDGRTTTSAYNAAGQLTTRRTPAGDTFSFEYDTVGDLLAKEVDGARTEYFLRRRRAPGCRLLRNVAAQPRVRRRRTGGGRDSRRAHHALPLRRGRPAHRPCHAHRCHHRDVLGRSRQPHRSERRRHSPAHVRARPAGPGDRAELGSARHAHLRLGRAGPVTGQSLASGGRRLHEREYAYRQDGHLASSADRGTGRRLRYELDPLGRPLSVATHRGTVETYRYDPAGNQAHAAWALGPGAADTAGARSVTGTRHAVGRAGHLPVRRPGPARRTQPQTPQRQARTWRTPGTPKTA